MRSTLITRNFVLMLTVLLAVTGLRAATETTAKSTASTVQMFDTPQDAAKALMDATANFDASKFKALFGAEGSKIVLTGEQGRDRELAKAFSEQAQEKNEVTVDPKNPKVATLTVGKEDWPFPAPIVQKGKKWSFDAKAGEKEIVYRRVGQNELDAIQICHGYVEAQYEYAMKQRKGYEVNQFAQRIISTSGTQDGLAWQNADGSWDGPIGENVAKALGNGYMVNESYHGYYFKVLKGQGPAAPLGKLDYVIQGTMIGGFALVAVPADYRVTGVKTFLVGNDGVVYQKDLGPDSLKAFRDMELYNPDKTWEPVEE